MMMIVVVDAISTLVCVCVRIISLCVYTHIQSSHFNHSFPIYEKPECNMRTRTYLYIGITIVCMCVCAMHGIEVFMTLAQHIFTFAEKEKRKKSLHLNHIVYCCFHFFFREHHIVCHLGKIRMGRKLLNVQHEAFIGFNVYVCVGM